MENAKLSTEDINRIVEMAWEDRTPFEHIEYQFHLSEKDVIKLMRSELKPSSFRLWRKRVSNRSTKHSTKNNIQSTRFKCPTQNKPKQPKQ